MTPGLRFIDGEISQINLCDVCLQPELRNFRQQIDVSETRFDARAGVGGWVSYRLGQGIRLGAQASYDYERLPVFNVPFTPTDQPARFERDDSHRFRAGAFLVIESGSRIFL